MADWVDKYYGALLAASWKDALFRMFTCGDVDRSYLKTRFRLTDEEIDEMDAVKAALLTANIGFRA